MKKFIFATLVLFLISCGSNPVVTGRDEIPIEEPVYDTDYYGNMIFRGKKKVGSKWVHWDNNKECPHQNGWKFRVTKNTPTDILKSDVCDHCGYEWDTHD